MTRKCLSRGLMDREPLALKNDASAELFEHSVSLDAEFHDREDLVYEHSAGEPRLIVVCLESLNISPRGGEFTHE